MSLRRLTILIALCMEGGTALGQTPAKPGPPPPTLAQALGRAAGTWAGVVLSVGAETVMPPEGAAPPGDGATAAQLAAAYGETLRAFGTVQAVAPATMTVLNTNPINPNPYDGLGPGDAMKLLAAGLTDGQWRALAGDAGLGLSDLSSDTQRQLFLLLLPRPLLITPLPVRGQAPPVPSETRDATDERTQARLRLRRNNVLFLPLAGENTYMPAAEFDAPGGARRYRMKIDSFFGHEAEVAGVPVRADVPNTPKPSQLDYNAPALKTPVPLAGLKTVGDLVFRVGKLTRMELYPDSRYEKKALTPAGRSAPAGDLLRAVAFCVTGTFRRVEGAYVLTDDVAGAGARREVWREFEDDAAAARQAALDAAGDKLAAAHTIRELAPVPGTLPLNAEEQKQADAALHGDGFMSAEVPLEQLSPAQQDAARGTPGANENGAPVAPDFKRKVLLNVMPQLELLLPSVPDPVDYNASSLFMDLFQTADERRRMLPPDFTLRITEMPGKAAGERLTETLKRIPRRAALATPSDEAALKDLLALMRQAGLNELWLPVPPTGDGLLPDALRDAQGTGIAVVPVLDLFTWPDKTPRPLQDLTLLGETSAQAAERHRRRAAQQAALAGDPLPDTPAASRLVSVSPFSEDVRRALTDRVRALTATPGVAGLVWRVTAPPGYDRPELRTIEDQSLLLGYTPAARLDFLRAAGADPIDLFPDAGQGRADTELPCFDDADKEAVLAARWRQRRADQAVSVLRTLRAGLPVTVRDSLLVQEQGPLPALDWFGSWDRPDAPLPASVRAGNRSVHEKARAQSHTALVRLPFPGVLTTDNLASRWLGALQAIADKREWDGFVLDMTRD